MAELHIFGRLPQKLDYNMIKKLYVLQNSMNKTTTCPAESKPSHGSIDRKGIVIGLRKWGYNASEKYKSMSFFFITLL